MMTDVQERRMSRGIRVARGAWFAAFATFFAAASHMLAGGNAPAPVALVVTMVAVLPLCVALAGRELSLWRVSLAVALSQGLFHWSFASIGATTAAATSSSPVSAHAEHLGLVSTFVPSFAASTTSASWLMLFSHVVAAACTVLMLRFGERAVRRIREAVTTAGARLFTKTLAPLVLPREGRAVAAAAAPLRPLIISRSSLSLRGPPRFQGCAA